MQLSRKLIGLASKAQVEHPFYVFEIFIPFQPVYKLVNAEDESKEKHVYLDYHIAPVKFRSNLFVVRLLLRPILQ